MVVFVAMIGVVKIDTADDRQYLHMVSFCVTSNCKHQGFASTNVSCSKRLVTGDRQIHPTVVEKFEEEMAYQRI